MPFWLYTVYPSDPDGTVARILEALQLFSLSGSSFCPQITHHHISGSKYFGIAIFCGPRSPFFTSLPPTKNAAEVKPFSKRQLANPIHNRLCQAWFLVRLTPDQSSKFHHSWCLMHYELFSWSNSLIQIIPSKYPSTWCFDPYIYIYCILCIVLTFFGAIWRV